MAVGRIDMGGFNQGGFGTFPWGGPPPVPPTPGPPQRVGLPVSEIYQRVCWDLLEDYNLVLGTVTPEQFLDALEQAILDFCQETMMVKQIFTQTIFLAQSQYIVPDDILEPQACFVGGVFLQPTTLEELNNGEYQWARQVGPPRAWFQDGLPVHMIQLFPIPDYTGTVIAGPKPPFGNYGDFFPTQRNLTIVGGAAPLNFTANPLTLQSNLPGIIPDSFTPYLVYRVLARIFSLDGECHDSQRAIYCQSRFEEGISLGSSVMLEAINDAK
jgi:hypothetical protein